MKSGRLEILLILLIVVGGGYFALQYFMRPAPQVMCGPLQLSAEVKAYIDQKMKDPGASADLTPFSARLEELESKVKTLDPQKYMAANEVVEKRRMFIAQKVREQRLSNKEIVDNIRNAELNRFRQETAMSCANVTKVKSTFAPGPRNRLRNGAAGGQPNDTAPAPQAGAAPSAPPANPAASEDFSPIATPPAPNPNGATGGQ